MGETLIIQNIDLYKSILMDRAILVIAFFLLLMISAFTKSAVIKRTSYKEMVVLSLFFAILFALCAQKLMEKVGSSIFIIVYLVGLVQIEAFYLVKKYTLYKVETFLNTKEDKNKKK